MPDSDYSRNPLRVTSVIASLTAGGIGPVCRYAAEGMAKGTDWQVTLLSLHDPAGEFTDAASGLRVVCLGLTGNSAHAFLDWLGKNPQDVVITSNVGLIEAAFPYLPATTRHIIQVHDSLLPYRRFATRNARWIDGVLCVANHITDKVRREILQSGFERPVETIHNAAAYPDLAPARGPGNSIRCLFMGYADAVKGIFDLMPLLRELRQLGVPVEMEIVGGHCQSLERRLVRKGLAGGVVWRGRVAHEDCYRLAGAADVFLMLSRKEPFGMVTIEAMSMGCVPIAYDTPSGSTEIIQHNKNGILVPLGDINAMAREIADLYHNRERKQKLSASAAVRARTGFSQEKMCAQLTGFIRAVVAHAEKNPAQRLPGRPEVSNELPKWARRTGYQRLPVSFRAWLRMQFYRRHKLAYWWLNR